MRFYLSMKPGFDSFKLWDKISQYHVNLTVLEDKVWVYGECEYSHFTRILYECRLATSEPIEIELE